MTFDEYLKENPLPQVSNIIEYGESVWNAAFNVKSEESVALKRQLQALMEENKQLSNKVRKTEKTMRGVILQKLDDKAEWLPERVITGASSEDNLNKWPKTCQLISDNQKITTLVNPFDIIDINVETGKFQVNGEEIKE